MTKQELLKTHFGYDTFREGQEAVIDALLAGKDVSGRDAYRSGKIHLLSGTGTDDERDYTGNFAV